MPTSKKRINLTVPDAVYEQIQAYKLENGLENDATACLQLVVKQLRSEENGKLFVNALRHLSRDSIAEISNEGLFYLKDKLDEEAKN